MELIKDLKKAFKSEIKYVKDLNILANDIAQTTNRNISVSTLRRVFGLLDSSSKLSAFNKDTLELYIREKNRLTNKVNNKDLSLKIDSVQSEYNDLKSLHQGLNEHLLIDIIDSNLHVNKIFKLLQMAILEAIESENIDFFIQLYRQNTFILSYSLFFRFLGSRLKEKPDFCQRLLPILAKEKNARRYLFELYIDFGNFNSYALWLDIYYETEPLYINKLWAISLLIYGNKLSLINNKLWDEYFELLKLCENELEQAHPYLKARVLGAGLINSEKQEYFREKIIKELENSHTEMIQDKSYSPLFATMVTQYILLFSQEDKAVTLIYKIFKSYQPINMWNQDLNISFYLLLCESIFNNTPIDLNEIKTWNSTHTNEDAPIKLFALEFVKDSQYAHEAKEYKKHLISESGFIYFDN